MVNDTGADGAAVTGPQQPGSRYVTDTAGAPPVPPPGGYRAAKRVPTDQHLLPDGAPFPVAAWVSPPKERRKPSWIGVCAIVAAFAFAVVLVGALAMQATDGIYSVNMVAAQLAVLGLVIAAICTKRGRVLGASALAVVLLCNVGTIGALTAVRTSVAGSYTAPRSEADTFWQAYPGTRELGADAVLTRPSLEEVRSRFDALFADVRETLTDEYGFTWESLPETLRPERNGYGGESMLQRYTSTVWATNEPISDVAEKYAIMERINELVDAHGMTGLISINDPSYGLSEDIVTKMFGSADPDTQVQWEWYTYDWDSEAVAYFDIVDLSKDTTGDFRTAREAMHDQTGEPLEGLQLVALGEYLLSEVDEQAFRDAISKYP